MARIRINIDELTVAMSDHDSEWVLDLETGQVLLADWIRDPSLHGGLDEDDDEDDDGDDMLDSPRFRFIDTIESREGFRWMERFAESQDERVRERLLDSLDRPRPFRRFRDALTEFPQVREAWFRYEEERLREEAAGWLKVEGIDAELFDARQSGGEAGDANR